MQLTINIKDGATNLEMAQQLRWQAGLLEGLAPKTASSRKNTDTPASSKARSAPSEEAATDDTDFAAAAADTGFDDDGLGAQSDESASFDEEEKPKKGAKGVKSTKPKKITLDDVNDACKAHAAAKGREETLGILKRKFKTQSVTALKPEQYEACISAMSVN